MNLKRRSLLLATPLLLTACDASRSTFHATDISKSQLGGDFPPTMLDTAQRHRSLDEFKGKLVILFFGYTSCPDICPSALSKYTHLLQSAALINQTQVIFVSLDPERDSPERLQQYLHWFHPSLIGLCADQRTIDEFTQKYRVISTKRAISGAMGYVIDHSAGAYVFDTQSRLRLYLAESSPAEHIVSDLLQLLASDR